MCDIVNAMLLFMQLFGLVQSAKILSIVTFPSYSHNVVYNSLWAEFCRRGHQVTVFTPYPSMANMTNLTEFKLERPYYRGERPSPKYGYFKHIRQLFKFIELLSSTVLDNTQFQTVLGTEQFDLVLIECFWTELYGIFKHFQAPLGCVSSWHGFSFNYDLFGNPTHPILRQDMYMYFPSEDLSLWQKIQLVGSYLWLRLHQVPSPPISMFLATVNPVFHGPKPNVPSVIELGMALKKPHETVTTDIQAFLDGAQNGAIYFSLGSVVSIAGTDIESLVIEVLSELPYKVVLKLSNMTTKSEKFLVRDWFPQREVLRHPNIKVFVTQGGQQSIQEAILYGVPLVGLPFITDQPFNVQRIVDLGIGVGLDVDTMTKDDLKMAIVEVAQNEKYRSRVKAVEVVLHDVPKTGLEKALWWVEYVVRHKGAKHLRCSSADISWMEFLLMDVAAVAILLVLLGYLTVKLVWGLFL